MHLAVWRHMDAVLSRRGDRTQKLGAGAGAGLEGRAHSPQGQAEHAIRCN